MSDFMLSPELEEFRSEVRKVADKAFAPKAAHWDRTGQFPEENRKLRADLGYTGLTISEEYGGSGGGPLQAAVCVEEIARACVNTGVIAQVYLNNVPSHVEKLGSTELKRRFLPKYVSGEYFSNISITEAGAGSAWSDLRTTANIVGDDVVLNGSKCFFTLGHVLTHALVVVRFGSSVGANGIGAVLVPREAPGLTVGPVNSKMGLRGIGDVDLFFDNCRVPVENILVEGTVDSTESFKTLIGGFGMERIGIAAQAVGVADGAFWFAKRYTEERTQFGRPICEFQGLQWKIADMATQIHAARLMTYHAASDYGAKGKADPQLAAMAKLYASEMVQRVTNDAIQLCGHYGYTTDAPLERMYRDARNWGLAGGSMEVMRNTIASRIYGRRFDRRAS